MEKDRFASPLDVFVQNAMLIAADRSKPISVQRQEMENLIAAVYVYGREQLLDTLNQRGIVPKDRDLLTP